MASQDSSDPDILNTHKDIVTQMSPIVEDDTTKNLSLIEYYGHDAHSCGYCKAGDNKGRWSYDLDAKRIKADDYQGLLDKGWRRSGTYCYRPMNSESCCPNFSIICDAINFKLTRSQRKCIERMNNYILTGNTESRTNYHGDLSNMTSLNENLESLAESFAKVRVSNKSRDKRFVASCDRKMKLYGMSEKEALNTILERKEKRLPRRFTLEDHLFPRSTGGDLMRPNLPPRHKLEIRMLHVKSEEMEYWSSKEHSLIQKYQAAVHKEEGEKWDYTRFADFLVNTPLITEIFHDCPGTSDTLSKFVQHQHFKFMKPPSLPTAFGTYHCLYLLDKSLIAVGVLDVLPKCITTVYFFYDPDYSFLRLGTYSALVEISMVRQMQGYMHNERIINKLVYYNLGFYVHRCDKMLYKARFKPSYLLCSETHEYVPTETCLKLLKDKVYVKFSDSSQVSEPEWNKEEILQHCLAIPFLTPVTKGAEMRNYIRWLKSNLGDRFVFYLVSSILPEYVLNVGPELARRMAFYCKFFHRSLVREYLRATKQTVAIQSQNS